MNLWSLETLGSVNNWLRLAAAVFSMLAAVSTLGTIFITQRISRLQSHKDKAWQVRVSAAEAAVQRAEKVVDPRCLTPIQKQLLIEALKHAPIGALEIKVESTASDGVLLAKDFEEVLSSAGIPFETVPTSMTPPLSGIVIGGVNNRLPLALFLHSACDDAGILTHGTGAAPPLYRTAIIIGRKESQP